MIQQFIDRETELRFLNDKFDQDRSNFIVIYGRRRIGKTELIKEFLKGKKSIYILQTKDSTKENIEELKRKFAEFTGKDYFLKLNTDSFYELFKYFKDEIKDEKIVIVFDEYPYLIELSKGIVSVFQKIWDELLLDSRIFLILCGSSIAMMENEVLDYTSPLYGRRTGEWNVGPFWIKELQKMYPELALEEYFKILSIFGGTPFYLAQVDPKIGIYENIAAKILRKGEILYNEPLFLLRAEFREPKVYTLILKYLSLGITTQGELQNATGIEKSNLSAYLQNLEDTRIIEYALPLGQRKRGIYYISDLFFNFWFRFVYPNMSMLELGLVNEVMEKIEKELNTYFGTMFERLVLNMVKTKRFNMNIEYEESARWWHKDKEIDLININEKAKHIYFFEIKWTAVNKNEVYKILDELRQKAKSVQWHNDERSEKFGLIARKIDPAIKQNLRTEDVLVFDLKDFSDQN